MSTGPGSLGLDALGQCGLPLSIYTFLPGDANQGGEKSGTRSHEEPFRAVCVFGLMGTSVSYFQNPAQPSRRPRTLPLREGKGPALPACWSSQSESPSPCRTSQERGTMFSASRGPGPRRHLCCRAGKTLDLHCVIPRGLTWQLIT